MNIGTLFYLIIIQPIYYVMETSFLVFNEILNNIGLSIIGISFVVTLLCLPLYMIAEKWQEQERQTQLKLKPGITRIKAVFKGDEQYMILSTYYKQNHYHPLMALRSSFSLLIQIPFFIAAYTYLSHLEILHGYSFLFIKDFGEPDSTFKIGNFAVNVLPIAMTLINCISGAIYSKGHDYKEKLQIYGCAAVFLVLLYNSPSGLVIYWTMNNILSLVKNVFYKMKNPKKVLYIIACLFSFILLIFSFTILANKKTLVKLVVIIFAVLIPAIPFIIKVLSSWFNSHFELLDSNKKLTYSLFISSVIGLSVLVGLVIPSMLISSEPENFCYVDNYSSPSIFIIQTLFQAIGFFIFWPSCIYFLFSKKTKKVMALLYSFLLLFGLTNTFIFSGKYGPLEQNLSFMTEQRFFPSKIHFLLNILSLVLIISAIILVTSKKPDILINFTTILCLGLLTVSIVNFVNISKTYKHLAKPEKITSIEPVYHLSKTSKNVIVIMQDRCFMPYIEEIFDNNDDIKQQFTGFTFYPNTTSFGYLTMAGSPGIFGGYDFTPFEINQRTDQTLQQKHNQALLTMPVLFHNAGYSVTVSNLPYENYLEAPYSQMYKDYPYINRQNTYGKYSDYWYTQKNVAFNKHTALEIKRNLYWFGLFKITPPLFRIFVYHNNYWNSIDYSSNRKELFVNNYAPLVYFNELTDFNSDNSAFLLIDNELTHRSLKLDGPDYLLEKSTDVDKYKEQSRDCQMPTMISLFKMYGKFFDYLKANGVYDNTRIIIVSDHGMNEESDLFKTNKIGDFTKDEFVATLLVKDFDSTDEIKTDYTFMTNADTPFLSLNGIYDNLINPFTNNPLKVTNKDHYTKITTGIAESTQNRKHSQFKIDDNQWFYVKDNIFDDSNWKILTPEEVMEYKND